MRPEGGGGGRERDGEAGAIRHVLEIEGREMDVPS